jgi:hypothetical protein
MSNNIPTLKEILDEYYDENRVEDEDSLIRRAYQAGVDSAAKRPTKDTNA